MANGEKILNISWGAIFRLALAALIAYFLFLIKDILILVVFALIISVLFNPAIDFLSKRRIPRLLGATIAYLLIFWAFGFLIYAMAPLFISEIRQFSQLFPQYFEKSSPILKSFGIVAAENFESFTQTLQKWLVGASSGIFNAIGAIFGGIFSTLTVFAIAFFLSVEEKGAEKMISLLFPKRHEVYVLGLWERCQSKVAGWFGTRIIGSLFVGLLVFISLKVLGVKYAVSLGILAGILDIIPFMGPIIAGVLLGIFAAFDSWAKMVFVLIIYIIIQQLENNVLLPFLTKKFIGLPPALVIIALMVGGTLWGILGAILAIPLFGILYEFLKDYFKKKREEKVVVL